MFRFSIAFSTFSNLVMLLQTIYIKESRALQAPDQSVSGSESGFIVVAGGNGTNDVAVANSYAYDIGAGSWISLPDLPSPRAGGGLVAHQGNVYYVSGRDNAGGVKNVLELSTVESVWIDGPPLRNVSLNGVNALSTNDSIFALGGFSSNVEKYDCNSGSYTWKKAASTLRMHGYSGAAVLDGYIYVCGCEWNVPSAFCERYDPATNTWKAMTPMNEPRVGLSMVALNGNLYVIGGADAKNERYDPINDDWTYFSSVPGQLFLQAAATDGKNIYAIGGYNGVRTLINMNQYWPTTDIWVKSNHYPIEIRDISAVFVEQLP